MEREAPLDHRESLIIIQVIVGLVLLVMGAYIVGPWYVVAPDTASFSAIIDTAGWYVKAAAALQLITGAGIIYGALTNNPRICSICTWAGVSMYALIVAMRLIMIGFVPIVWVPQLALLLICAVLALTVRGR